MFPNFLLDILFPPICLACRTRIRREAVCGTCLASIPIRDFLSCGQCLRPLRLPAVPPAEPLAAAPTAQTFSSPCHPDFPYLLGAASNYENPIVQLLIHNLKFRSVESAAEPLADLLLQYCRIVFGNQAALLKEFTMVPIPISRKRNRQRGFNQTELIARRIAGEIAIPLSPDMLIRAKHAKPQSATKSEAERAANIRGAFAVGPATVAGRKILLIDDVSTSGATFREAAQTLKNAGAETVLALAAAKT